ncbi:MAG: hypothetical protein KQH53_03395 [Desulfarculaceae bacterium]|nr:hypothetical protein [Desulfarculaceae bacterium]
MTRYSLPLIVLIALLLAAAPAWAVETNPALSALTQAQGELEQGKKMEAFRTTEKALSALWDHIPFSLDAVVLTEGPTQGYGLFTPRKSNTYRQGQTIYAYVEPLGQRIRKKGDLYVFSLSADVALLKPDGTILWGKDDFAQWKFTSRRANREFFINIRLTLNKIPAGEYLLSIRVNDRLTGRAASHKLKVVFAK